MRSFLFFLQLHRCKNESENCGKFQLKSIHTARVQTLYSFIRCGDIGVITYTYINYKWWSLSLFRLIVQYYRQLVWSWRCCCCFISLVDFAESFHGGGDHSTYLMRLSITTSPIWMNASNKCLCLGVCFKHYKRTSYWNRIPFDYCSISKENIILYDVCDAKDVDNAATEKRVRRRESGGRREKDRKIEWEIQ